MAYLEALRQMLGLVLAGESQGLVVLALWLSGFAGLGSLVYQLRLRRWPVARGRLLKAGSRLFGNADWDVSSRDYVHDVVYEYTVGNVRYEGTRVSAWVLVTSHNLKAVLAAQLGDVDAGDAVDVIYNPRRPDRAFLKRPPVVGMIVTVVAAGFMLMTPVLAFGP